MEGSPTIPPGNASIPPSALPGAGTADINSSPLATLEGQGPNNAVAAPPPANQALPAAPPSIPSSVAGGGVKKKTGRRKINIEFIDDKSRRQITFSKRKAGLMKKAYELTTLTGTQALLLVASETGHVYTFATPKLQPFVTLPEGKNLIQSCLNAPDETPGQPPPSIPDMESPAAVAASAPPVAGHPYPDERMNPMDPMHGMPPNPAHNMGHPMSALSQMNPMAQIPGSLPSSGPLGHPVSSGNMAWTSQLIAGRAINKTGQFNRGNLKELQEIARKWAANLSLPLVCVAGGTLTDGTDAETIPFDVIFGFKLAEVNVNHGPPLPLSIEELRGGLEKVMSVVPKECWEEIASKPYIDSSASGISGDYLNDDEAWKKMIPSIIGKRDSILTQKDTIYLVTGGDGMPGVSTVGNLVFGVLDSYNQQGKPVVVGIAISDGPYCSKIDVDEESHNRRLEETKHLPSSNNSRTYYLIAQ